MVETNVQQKIAEAAHTEYGWNANEVRVDEVERLRRRACSFYTVAHTVRPLSYQANYGLLAGKEVIGNGDGKVVAKILDSCAADAPAEWWAEIVTRFHRDLGAGIVLVDESTRPDVFRRLKEAGKPFTPPTLDPARKVLRYLLLDPETNVVYRVEAKRTAGGEIEVSKSELL
jgi:hypothetical protein